LLKTNPGIGLFYIHEDKEKYLMIHRDGTVERFGYPGAPSIKDMENKYGTMPNTTGKDAPSAAYLARWAAISAQAEKDFHTTSKDVKAIIFPGDSRVIAVPASGKPEVYDMMNDDPGERPKFEALYGPLPNCVPAPTLHTTPVVGPTDVTGLQYSPLTPATPASKTTTPNEKPDTAQPADNPWHWGTTHPDYHKSIWIVDGLIKPKGWNGPDSLNHDDVAHLSFYSGPASRQLFGDLGGEDGVYYILTKKIPHSHLQVPITSGPLPQGDPTLYIVDGEVVNYNALDSIPSAMIKSVYIPKAGVVVIQTVKAGHAQVVIKNKDTSGNVITGIADSFNIVTPNGTFHIGTTESQNLPNPFIKWENPTQPIQGTPK
jgi:hypothetical protein